MAGSCPRSHSHHPPTSECLLSALALMIGASAYPRLVVMYGVSGIVAGLGGALMAINTGIVGLDSVSFERSAEVLVMLVLGGAGNLWGALAGAVIFQIFEHIVSAANPFHWMTLVGLLLILIVILNFKVWRVHRSTHDTMFAPTPKRHVIPCKILFNFQISRLQRLLCNFHRSLLCSLLLISSINYI